MAAVLHTLCLERCPKPLYLTRVTTLRQLHFWCLNMDAFVAHPGVEKQYFLLRQPGRVLTQAVVDASPPTGTREAAADVQSPGTAEAARWRASSATGLGRRGP